MTAEERVKLQIGELVINLIAAQATIESQAEKIKELEGKPPEAEVSDYD